MKWFLSNYVYYETENGFPCLSQLTHPSKMNILTAAAGPKTSVIKSCCRFDTPVIGVRCFTTHGTRPSMVSVLRTRLAELDPYQRDETGLRIGFACLADNKQRGWPNDTQGASDDLSSIVVIQVLADCS